MELGGRLLLAKAVAEEVRLLDHLRAVVAAAWDRNGAPDPADALAQGRGNTPDDGPL